MVSALTRNMRSFILHEFLSKLKFWLVCFLILQFFLDSLQFPVVTLAVLAKRRVEKVAARQLATQSATSYHLMCASFFLQFSIQGLDDSMIQQAIVCNKLSLYVCQFFLEFSILANQSATNYHLICVSFFLQFQFWQPSLQ